MYNVHTYIGEVVHINLLRTYVGSYYYCCFVFQYNAQLFYVLSKHLMSIVYIFCE